jgi:hypothetical protein
MQLRWLRCYTVIDCKHHPLPILCSTVPEVRADTEVVVLNARSRNVLQPAAQTAGCTIVIKHDPPTHKFNCRQVTVLLRQTSVNLRAAMPQANEQHHLPAAA